MKKLFFFAAALFAATSFSACSDDDDNGGGGGSSSINYVSELEFSWADYDGIVRTQRSYKFEYDGRNRLTKVTEFMENRRGEIVYPKQDEILEFNEKGYIVMYDDGEWIERYTYDTEGHLINEDGDLYTWENGDRVLMQSYTLEGELNYYETLTYSEHLANLNYEITDLFHFLVSYLHPWINTFAGHKSKHLLQSIKYPDGDIRSFEYEFDGKGCPITIVEKWNEEYNRTCKVSYK